MLTKKYTFRPAWALTVGPGLILAMLLSALIVVVAGQGTISAGVALRLHLIPNLILAGFYVRWLLQGCIVVKPNQVVFRGWMKAVDQEGHLRTVYVEQYVPRREWDSIAVLGLLFPAVTWSRLGQSILFDRVSRPHLLRKLLAAPSAEFDQEHPLSPLLLILIGAAAALKLVISVSIRAITWLVPGARPYLKAAARWAFRQARRGLRATKRQVAPHLGGAALAYEYARFVAFCQKQLFDGGSVDVRSDLAQFYLCILERARIVQRRVNGRTTWVPYPRIQSIDDVRKRISRQTFAQMWLDSLLASLDLENTAPGEAVPVPIVADWRQYRTGR